MTPQCIVNNTRYGKNYHMLRNPKTTKIMGYITHMTVFTPHLTAV